MNCDSDLRTECNVTPVLPATAACQQQQSLPATAYQLSATAACQQQQGLPATAYRLPATASYQQQQPASNSSQPAAAIMHITMKCVSVHLDAVYHRPHARNLSSHRNQDSHRADHPLSNCPASSTVTGHGYAPSF